MTALLLALVAIVALLALHFIAGSLAIIGEILDELASAVREMSGNVDVICDVLVEINDRAIEAEKLCASAPSCEKKEGEQ